MQRRDDSRSVVRRGPEIADATRPLVTPIFPATAYVAESRADDPVIERISPGLQSGHRLPGGCRIARSNLGQG